MEHRWDAGELGCGALVAELARRINQLDPGEQLEVTVSDPGAKIDLPAWCRMSGNQLIKAEHPVYLIQRETQSS